MIGWSRPRSKGSYTDQRLDRAAFVHRFVRVGNAVEVGLVVEHTPRVDAAFEHVVERFRDVGARRGGTTQDALRPVEQLRRRELDSVRDADVADHGARSRNRERGLHRLASADAFERRVDADAAGECHDGLGHLLAAPFDEVGGAELLRQRLRAGVAAEGDYALGTEPLDGQDARDPDRAVADDRDRLASLDARADGGVMAGGQHVRERQERVQHLVRMAGARHRHERAVGERDAYGLALAAVAVLREEAAGQARGRDAVLAVRAGAVAVGERGDDEVALLDLLDVGADILDDADELVPDGAGRELGLTAVEPEVGAADARQDDTYDRVG